MKWNIEWRGGIFGGVPLANYPNTRAACDAIGSHRYNALHHQAEIRSALLTVSGWQSLSDRIVSAYRQILIDEFGFDPKTENIVAAIRQLAWEELFDPLKMEIESAKMLEKDGVPLCKFFTYICGAPDTEFMESVSVLFWVALVARGLSPGIALQLVFILFGKQGAGKSTVLQIIAGNPAWFTDQDVIGLPAQQQQEALRGRWVVEAAELSDLFKNVEKAKAFISRTHDRARPAWGRCTVDEPRRFVMVATTNEPLFLQDTTGNRRFIVVPTKRINLPELSRLRGHFLAQARDLWLSGYGALELPKEFWKEAAEHAARYRDDDPWEAQLAELRGQKIKGEWRVSFDEVWVSMNIPLERRTRALKHRLIDAMRRLGWTFDGRPMRIDDTTCRGFRRKP